MPATEAHSARLPTCSCSAKAPVSGSNSAPVRPNARNTGWQRANSMTREFTSISAAWVRASADAINAAEARVARIRTTPPASAATPIRQSKTNSPATTVSALVVLTTSGVTRCALLVPTKVVPLTAIWDTWPTRSRVNQPSGRVTMWSPSRWCSSRMVVRAIRIDCAACT